MRLRSEETVCNVSSLAGMGKESALLSVQRMALPWLMAVTARLWWLAVRGWMGFLGRGVCTQRVTAVVCSNSLVALEDFVASPGT